MPDNLNINLGGGYSFKVVAFALIAGIIVGSAGAIYLYPQPQPQTVTLTETQFVPQVVEKILHVPYEVAKEIVKEKEAVKEVKVPVPNHDYTIKVPATPTEPSKQYNIILDRPREIGLMVTSESIGIVAGYAPEKHLGYKLYVGQKYNGGLEAGVGVVRRF
jgi:hypothetical protein